MRWKIIKHKRYRLKRFNMYLKFKNKTIEERGNIQWENETFWLKQKPEAVQQSKNTTTNSHSKDKKKNFNVATRKM